MKLYLSLFLLLYTANVFSQEVEKLWCHELGEIDGLSSQEYNFYVHCDSEDYAWVSSVRGLNRFDGYEVKEYHSDFQDSTALFGENIQSNLFEDGQSNLWFCTYEAIHYYDRERDEFKHFFVRDTSGNLIQEDYYVFYLEQNRFLWFRAGKNNIYRLDISNPSQIEQEITRCIPLFQTLHFHAFVGLDENDAVKYIFTSSNEKRSGLEYFEIKEGKLVKGNSSFSKTDLKHRELTIFQTYYEDAHRVWISTATGLVKWDIYADTIQAFPFLQSSYSYLAPYNREHLLVSFYNNGLHLFNKKTGTYRPFHLESINNPDKEVNKSIRNIYLDRNRVLWITRPGEGLLYVSLDKRKFNSYDKTHTESDVFYKNLIKLANDSILATHFKGFLWLDEKGRKIDELINNNLPGFDYMIQDRITKQILIATRKGIYTCDLDKKKFVRVVDTKYKDVLYLYQLQSGELLATVLNQGIFQLMNKNGIWKVKPIETDQKAVNYTSVFQDHSGAIYMCRNESGIDVFSWQGNFLERQGQLPVLGAVNCYYEDTLSNVLWFGTSFGLVKKKTINLQNDYEVYTKENGLSDNTVYQIFPGYKNQLWLSTYKGLCLFDPSKNNIHAFSLTDGMLSDQFNAWSGLQMEDGTIWFGGNKGITVVPSDSISYLKKQARILISNFEVAGAESDAVHCKKTNTSDINQVEHLEFPHWQNTLVFQFIATTDYADPSRTRLRYKLKNKEEQWLYTNPGEKGYARYRDVAPGDYLLSIEGINSDGVTGLTAKKEILITILSPFYATWWFKTLAIALVLGLGMLAYRLRMNQIQEKEGLKTRIAENKMSALIAQMNPHFIFNSLQSVNRFILKGEKKQASEYLGRFSGLMRMMLENSRETHHVLEAEIKFLQLYMKVEAQRFKKPFSYDIIIDQDIDEYNTDVPTMMIQPFVENAIWHGISHKEDGGGQIRITINKQGKLLRCIIQDNGVGRKKAAEIAAQNGKHHNSRALQIVTERLHLLFPQEQKLCTISYTDLKNENGKASGTRVSISLPFVG